MSTVLIEEVFHFRAKIREFILAATDTDADTFKDKIAPRLLTAGPPATHFILFTDASTVDTGLLGHSYCGDNRSVIADIYYLIDGHLRAYKRFSLKEIQVTGGSRCVFSHCISNAYRGSIANDYSA
jgi:hypothetical protein